MPSNDFWQIGSNADPTMGSGGGAFQGAGRGGGRIIISSSYFTMNTTGVIDASGSNATGADLGGGSGGSITIDVFEMLVAQGTIRAKGGFGFQTGGGGGGGRIALNVSIDSFVMK